MSSEAPQRSPPGRPPDLGQPIATARPPELAGHLDPCFEPLGLHPVPGAVAGRNYEGRVEGHPMRVHCSARTRSQYIHTQVSYRRYAGHRLELHLETKVKSRLVFARPRSSLERWVARTNRCFGAAKVSGLGAPHAFLGSLSATLEGIRVLDFGRYIAGPYTATLMADLGADVIRVERVDGAEDRFVTPVAEDGTGAMYLQLARNKRSLTLNPRKPEGLEIVAKLVATADIVVANLTQETLRGLGLDYESLRAIKRDIILVTNTAFGQGGPWSDRYGFDGLAQAMSGVMHMSGRPEQPTRASVPFVDFNTAALCAFGAMAALRHRDRTGEGQEVQGALLRSALNMMGATLIEQDMLQVNRQATLNRGQTNGPSDTVRTKDGWVMCLVIGPHQFRRWCQVVGRSGLADDPDYSDDLKHGERGEELSRIMAEWCRERTTEEVLAAMEAAKVPAGPVLSPQEALDDEHVREIGYFDPVEYPAASKPLPVARTPIALSATPGRIRHRAPKLGEPTAEILRELGYEASEIESLRAARVV